MDAPGPGHGLNLTWAHPAECADKAPVVYPVCDGPGAVEIPVHSTTFRLAVIPVCGEAGVVQTHEPNGEFKES